MSRYVVCLTVLALLIVGSSRAQDQESVVETDPPIPTVNQSVTIYFNADEGTQGLEDVSGDIYAHTGVFTSASPDEWKCVKNHWPTSSQFAGNRDDTKLEKVGTNRYKLTIDDIRAYYQNTSTECNLTADETVQTMNFVFRDGDGSREGKAEGGEDIIVDLGDPDQSVFARIQTPASGIKDPVVISPQAPTDTTVSVLAVAQAPNTSLQEFTLTVNGQREVTTSNDSIQYSLSLSQAGRKNVRVKATDDQGNVAADSFYVVRAAASAEEPVPSGMEDGINYTSSSSVTLVLQAPRKEFVHVVGDFTDWEVQSSYQMKRETNQTGTGQDSTRYWIRIEGLQSGKKYGFQYLVDGEVRIPDPYSGKVLSPNDSEISEQTYPDLKPYPTDKTDQLVSVLEPGKQEYQFQASDYQRPQKEDLVIYELLVRDFIEKHNYQTLQDTLDYLDDLGVNAIELMPVSEFDNNQSWGYNPALYFATDKYYGPAKELKRFIDMAHQRDIAVILDVVYNQATGQSPFVRLFNDGTYGRPTEENPWVNRYAKHPFNVFYDNNHESSFTKHWLDRANEYWLTEFNVDGFRFDLSKGFTQTQTCDDEGGNCDVGAWSSYDQSRVDILTRMADKIWSVDSDAYVILEHFAAPNEEEELATHGTDQGRPGMLLWNNMNEPYRRAAEGISDGSALTNTYYRNRGFDIPNYVTYMESHDEQWLMRGMLNSGRSSADGSYSIKNLETALNRQKLVGVFFFTVPGPRMMWQFGELGYGWGSEECLKGGGGECPSSAPGRTAPKPIRWSYFDEDQSPNRVKLYKTWSALITLRNQNDVFTSQQTDVSMKVGEGDRVRRIILNHESMDVVVLGNFGVQRRAVNPQFPTSGTWYDFFSGTAVEINSDETGTEISLAPGEFHVFTSKNVDTPEPGLVPFSSVAPPPDPPTNLKAQTGTDQISLTWTASPSSDLTGYALYRGSTASFDTTGRRLATLGPEAESYSDASVSEGQTYHYRLAALDADGEKSSLTGTASAVLYPTTVSFSASRSFGDGSRPQDYRLVALPGQIDRPLARTLSGTAGDDWQAYWDDGSESDFFVQFDGSSTFALEPGRGFWLISDSTWSVQREVSTVPLEQDNVTTIDLHSGWNIISNPFDQAVNWTRVQSLYEGQIQPLWAFEGSFQQTAQFVSAKTGEAFYFLNSQGLDELKIPYSASKSARSTAKRSQDIGDLLTLEIGRKDQWGSKLQVGWYQEAETGLDRYDWVAPPNRFSALSLRARASSTPNRRQKLLARAVQPESRRGQSVPLTLQSESDESVSLRVQGLVAIGDDEAQLVNEGSGRTFDLRRTSSFQIQPSSESTNLTLLVGSSSYVREKANELTTTELQLRPSGPNPFRQETTLAYTMPGEGDVTLEIFDVLGRRVRVLVDEAKEAGTYHASWQGTDDAGQGVASGVYLARLSFGGETLTQKLVLVK